MNRDTIVGIAVLTTILLSISFVLIADPTDKPSSLEGSVSSKKSTALLDNKKSYERKKGKDSVFGNDLDTDSMFGVDYMRGDTPPSHRNTQENTHKNERIVEKAPEVEHQPVATDFVEPTPLPAEETVVVQENRVEPEPELPLIEANNANISKEPEPKALNPLSIEDQTYKIQRDDTLSSIAAKFYNDSRKYTLIIKANQNLDPKKLKVGDTIILPSFDRMLELSKPEPEPVKVEMKKVSLDETKGLENINYKVKSGDTISAIAKKYYGSANKWKLIQEANPNSDLNKLKVGQVIILPGKQ